jgi:phthalate 4,5-dioxygenase oxygenase subunit
MALADDYEILTRVGSGTPMGEMMREYWIPAAMSSELAADGPPLRLKLLGEKLIAFRDTAGRVGVFDHRCPHRCASLFFGRNEQNGIRCVYHGWKFDVDGKCLEQPNVPAHQSFADKVSAKAYRTAERNGLIYVFMGRKEAVPPLPFVEATLVPEDQVNIEFVQRECSWLQGVEGELDTSHVGFLHFGLVQADSVKDKGFERPVVTNRAPEYIAKETDYGAVYAAYRPNDESSTYWRFGHLLLPFWTMPPINGIEDNVLTRAYVPLDDEHTMIIEISRKGAYDRLRDRPPIPGASQLNTFLPQTSDWLGRFRLAANMGNDFLIDREVQRTRSYTGIEGVQLQDQAMQESMGMIVDRSLEHLAPSDMMVGRARRLLIRAARAHAENGTMPPGAADPSCQEGARGGFFVAPQGQDWMEAYADQLAAERQAAE